MAASHKPRLAVETAGVKVGTAAASKHPFFFTATAQTIPTAHPASHFVAVGVNAEAERGSCGGGKRRRFSTGETGIKKAQSKAAAIMADIKNRGFDEATKLHSKRRDEIPDDPTIDQFAELYRVVIATAEAPPSRTSERYIRCLERVCEGAGVTRVCRLNATAVERDGG